MNVLVVAGTADGRNIIEKLLERGHKVHATVTTAYGDDLLNSYPGLKVHQGKLNSEGMEALIREKGINILVDASHPFAKEASINAIAACESANIPYLRFERESVAREKSSIIRVKSFEEAASTANFIPGNIFLTIGSNNIKYFTDRVSDYKDRLFARVLPDSKMISKCEEAGLNAGNIIAMKGPFSTAMNRELLKYCNAAVMVTKESGDTGGTAEKLEAAAELGVKVILIERPDIDYKTKVSTTEAVLKFIDEYVLQGREL
jgi:precorrin-6A/cobalt-precorrin-6A reductase